jgi:hypothetical protein
MKYINYIIALLFLCNCSNNEIKYILRDNPKPDTIKYYNGNIYYIYSKAYNDSLFDVIHGYHEMAGFLSNPSQLSYLFKKYDTGNPIVHEYIQNLSDQDINGRKLNAVAIFMDLYWRLVSQIYKNTNYIKINNKLRCISIQNDRVQTDIIDQLSSNYLYINQITVTIDYSKCFNNASTLIIGDENEFKNYLNNSLELIFKDYIIPAKASSCASFPFSELPIDIKSAFSNFIDLGLNFNEFSEHFNQYRLLPNIIAKPGAIPEFKLKLGTDMHPTNIISIPIPVSLKRDSKKDIYIMNTGRAVIGNLLRTGINREFIIIIKISEPSHRELFLQYIEFIKKELFKKNTNFTISENSNYFINNQNIILARFKIIPNQTKCESIEVVNTTINNVKKYFEKIIEENDEINNRYFCKNSWEQIIFVCPQ